MPASTTLHMTVELHTNRLLLRPLQLSDAEQTQRLFPQGEILNFLNSKVPCPYPVDRVLPRRLSQRDRTIVYEDVTTS